MEIKKFKKIYIEITNACNLSCEFCPKTKRTMAFMKVETFKHILNSLKGQGKFLYFHVMGEPLLHPEIQQFLDLCVDSGFMVNLTTNGTLIGKAGDCLLKKEALRQVNFSLHSFNANELGFSIDSYLNDIFYFINKAVNTTNIKICLRLWNLSEDLPNESNRYILERIEREFSLEFKITEQLSPVNGIKLKENVFLNQSMTFSWPDINREAGSGKSGFCYGLRDQVAILVDGTVVPCCLDSEGVIKLGNINETTLNDIIKSPRAQMLYSSFSNRKVHEKLCLTCGYRTRFDLK